MKVILIFRAVFIIHGGFSNDFSWCDVMPLTIIEHVTRTRSRPIIPAPASTSIIPGIATSTIGQIMVVTLSAVIAGSIGVIAAAARCLMMGWMIPCR
ncbi:hypothetical protein ACFOKF_13425 [Sphingobium rhizovicinum]|uniref:Secreted peptide n=1 Tax=Sphingobium rhizovicinum TaxID=432308 RepID=A0ABV7NIM1_9SPHN